MLLARLDRIESKLDTILAVINGTLSLRNEAPNSRKRKRVISSDDESGEVDSVVTDSDGIHSESKPYLFLCSFIVG